MGEARFSDTLKEIGAALEGAEETVRQQVRAAAESAVPKWKKSGSQKELAGFAAALPDGAGAAFLSALGDEIALRGIAWAREHLFAALGEFCPSLKGVGAEA